MVELASRCVPEDPASPTPVEGYVVDFMVFYERGFGVPLHRFLCLLLQYYGLELHNLTPWDVMHRGLSDYARPSLGLTPILTCGITSFVLGSRRL
jgi:hypothetical protein